MSGGALPGHELGDAITALYSGPLDDFIRRRDALAKEYRTAGNRAAANDVKALRKPSRLAWALNAAMVSGRDAVEAFDHAVADVVRAQGTGGDVRAAMAALRAAVRDLATSAAEVARRAGHEVQAAALSTAILAVLGSAESYARLRTGQLVEIPEGGGLDVLAGLSTTSSVDARAAAKAVARDPGQPDAASIDAEVARATGRVTTARSRADAATRLVHHAKAELAAAEQRVREAEREREAAGRRHENALQEAAAAAAELQDAEAALHAARRS